MQVSANQPFQIIYSLFQHEYLGFLFESFVVRLDDSGKLTFQHQNISSKNAREFASGLDENDYELIKIMDSMQTEVLVNHFTSKPMRSNDFFLKNYDPEKGNKQLQEEIENYLERRRAKILPLLRGKMLFEMGNDGEPAHKRIEVMEEKATVLFHFRKNNDNTHYFPTIKHEGKKLDWQYKGAMLICKNPAWLMLNHKLYSFKKEVDGNKLRPFLNKKFIVIPKDIEEKYYRKFVAPLIASFDVYAKGFEINSQTYNPSPVLNFAEIQTEEESKDLFDQKPNGNQDQEGKILFELKFGYGDFCYKADRLEPVSVSLVKENGEYIFHRIRRKQNEEKKILHFLNDKGLELRNGRVVLPKPTAFSWLHRHKPELEDIGFDINQSQVNGKKFFLGKASIKIEINESIDWFDINALIKFGDYEIPFRELRKNVLKKNRELKLPNGEIAVIPEAWFKEYSEFFAFIDEEAGNGKPALKKHHLELVKDLQGGDLAKVNMSRKLESLRDYHHIEETAPPTQFQGTLRPYQKAGYNWLQFLKNYKFGGCLADDMGLGKTVQTLALLQQQKEEGHENASLLIMPTSLIYNWEMEIKRFTPRLKTFIYSGTNREKDPSKFQGYDIVLTSYGIARLDTDVLLDYYFNYIILDESQAIKNPASNISKAVRKLSSRNKLILTGTPIENSTMDLWSQMAFINPGLLGSQGFFKNEFLGPIEKKQDEDKIRKLHLLVKPFILRRLKSQVAEELPEKIEKIQFSNMTHEQEEYYEEVKSLYRNQILDNINQKGLNQSHLILLQGLTKLRQIANHPSMVDQNYNSDSGKMEDVMYMLLNVISEGNKALIFSQFVKHLRLLRNILDREGINYSYLDGATKDRKTQVENFQNDSELKVFLISLKAGGLGLNLTKADYVFILDPWWNPAVEAQAIDRAHRIGREDKVFTYKFITKDTVEEKILALQQKKIKLAEDLIKTEESFVKTLSKNDIETILT